ncbi:MAG: PDZ domain-containing protein [Chloroflexi bacterium]|nr:PDZ domain-containing protein [Chloroflexota bacterium]
MKKRWIMYSVAALLAIGLLAVAVGGGSRFVSAQPSTPESGAKGWLGILITDLNEKVAARLGVTDKTGVIISQVLPQSPAAQSGLQVKDIVTAINGKAVANSKELKDAISKLAPGSSVTVTVKRGDTTKDVAVTLGTAPVQPSRKFGGALPKELEGVSPGEIFRHFLGGDLRITDKDGKPVTLSLTPGIVASVDSNSLTITPNGQSQNVTFKITADTRFTGGSISSIGVGNQVIVVTASGSLDAKLVVKTPSVRGLRNVIPHILPFHRGGNSVPKEPQAKPSILAPQL